ncbi:MAG: hypothetical protein PVG28_04740 [Desulfobacterales bacterium]|jgi:hypothetical protein
MYTGYYQVHTDFIKVLQGGPEQQEMARKESNFFTVLEGKLVAKVVALLIEHGFQAFTTIDAMFKKNSFFEDNFVILDDSGKDAVYQGKFLIRTQQPGDQMNVWFGFLQGNVLLAPLSNFAKKLRDKTEDRIDLYSILKSTNLVSTKTLSEAEADQYENDPDRVDLVLRFKDIPSIYGLLQSQNLDMVDLMFKNLLQIYGNQNHMYKLGAITKNLQLALGL